MANCCMQLHSSQTHCASQGRGVLPEKLGRGVQPNSQNPYPIYDENVCVSLPYL